MADSIILSCPQCSRGGFKTRHALRDHFVSRHQAPAKPAVVPANKTQPPPSTKGTSSSSKLHPNNQPNQSNRPSAKTPSANTAKPKPNPKRRMQPARPRPSGANEAPERPLLALEPIEQELIYRYLRARYHTEERLIAQGFTMLPGDPADHPRKSDSPRKLDKSKRPPVKICTFQRTPRSPFAPGEEFTGNYRRAVVIDCEMVAVAGPARELAFLTAVDFLTGEVLIDHYVKPINQVTSWDTRYSGVTPMAMELAVANGTAIWGWPAARQRLWQFVCDKTVLIGHSLQNDLNVLGIIHGLVVDSAILTAEAVFPTLLHEEPLIRTWSLKDLTKIHLQYRIQVGKKGHKALEDVNATREMVIWCIRNPDLLRDWADWAREDERRKARERWEKQEQAKAAKEEAAQAEAAKEEAAKAEVTTETLSGDEETKKLKLKRAVLKHIMDWGEEYHNPVHKDSEPEDLGGESVLGSSIEIVEGPGSVEPISDSEDWVINN